MHFLRDVRSGFPDLVEGLVGTVIGCVDRIGLHAEGLVFALSDIE